MKVYKSHTLYLFFKNNNNNNELLTMAQLSCGVQFTRAALFALNLLFLITGFSVMGLGIYMKVNGNFRAISEVDGISQALGGEVMQDIAIGLIIVGVFTACLAGFGCLGM
jgi:hypothetical protein